MQSVGCFDPHRPYQTNHEFFNHMPGYLLPRNSCVPFLLSKAKSDRATRCAHIGCRLLLALANSRRIVLLRDSHAGMAEHDADALEGNAGHQQLHDTLRSKSVATQSANHLAWTASTWTPCLISWHGDSPFLVVDP